MRTRFLISLVGVAGALLIPSAALADVGQPTILTPATPSATNQAPAFTWDTVPDALVYRVLRGDSDCLGLVPVSIDLTATSYTDDNPAPPPEGTYCYKVEADDSVTTADSDPVYVTYDQTVPDGSVTAPATGATLASPVSVSASTTDVGGSGVASVEFFASPSAFPGTWGTIGSDSVAPFAVNWSPVTDGMYDFEAVITDKAGNTFTTTSDAMSVTIDGAAPSGAISLPASGATLHGATNALSATASDATSGVASVRFERSNGAGWSTITTDSSPPYDANWNTTGLDGSFNIHAVITDAVGHPFTTPDVPVTVDNTPPAVTLTGVANNTKVRGSLALAASATDTGGSGVAAVTFSYRLGSSGPFTQIGSPDTTFPYAVSPALDTTAIADGTYEFQASATDVIGNPASTSTVTNVLVDNTPPAVSLTGIANNAKVRGSLAIGANATDTSGSGVVSVAFGYRLGSSGSFVPIGSPDATSPYAVSPAFDTTAIPDGTYEFQALALDAAGNANTTVVTNVLVDNTVPTVSLSGVASNTPVNGALALAATAADTGSTVASVTFGRRLGSSGPFITIQVPDTTSPYGVSFDTTLISDGLYQIQALATDVAGNTASDPVTNVLVDNHAPAVPAVPTGLTPVSAAPTITFSASTDPQSGGVASGIAYYDVYRTSTAGTAKVNAAPIDGTVAGPYTWSDVTGQSSDPAAGTNTYSYRVVAVDKAGNASAQSSPRVIVLDPSAASAPGSVSVAATPSSQLPRVSWTEPPAAPFTIGHYNIYRNGGTLPVGSVAYPTTTWTEPSGLADGTYTYQIVAETSDNVTHGVASGAVTAVYDTTAPSGPGSVAAGAALDGSVAISWVASTDAGSGIARYIVRRSLSSTPPATPADGDATCQGTATSCTDATTLNGKLYSYSVFAVDKAGNISAAGNSPAVTARDQTAPAVPKGLSAAPGDASVSLSWTPAGADDDVAGYVLVAKQGAAAPASETDGTRVCNTIDATSSSCVASGLTNGAGYTFGLFALDEALNRSAPAVVSAAPNGHVDDTTAPAAVTKLRVKLVGHKVTLTWKNPADRDFDHVVITASDRKPTAKTAAKRVYSGKGTKTTTKLAAGQARWFVVVAYDVAGNASAPASVRAAVAPASPFGPAPRAKVHGKVRLTWPVVRSAKYYNVQLYAGKKRILVGWPAGHAFVLPRGKLVKGKQYTWYVWPGLGAKAKAHYGKLIGKNVFTFTG